MAVEVAGKEQAAVLLWHQEHWQKFSSTASPDSPETSGPPVTASLGRRSRKERGFRGPSCFLSVHVGWLTFRPALSPSLSLCCFVQP